MFLRFALCVGMVTAAVTLAAPRASWAQGSTEASPPAPPASPTKPAAGPAEPGAPAAPAAAPGAAAAPSHPFGEDTTLVAKPIVYLKGTGTWDKVFETISTSVKTLKTFVDKEGLKADGPAMMIFTSPDDTGFQYQAAVPIAAPPKNPPHGDIGVGTSPEGHALKFVYHGPYDGLDDTYEAITNYLDEKRLDAKDMYIEEYVTDPQPSNEDNLVVNVFVLLK